MSNPPPLPKRHTQLDRAQETSATATLSEPTKDAPPMLPSRSKTTTSDLPPATEREGSATVQPSDPSIEPAASRFVAPLPGTPTSPQTRITGALRTVLEMFPSQRPDTPEEAAIRRRLEEEQIARYMNSFSKHVQYLRMDPDSAAKRPGQDGAGNAGAIRQKPKVEDFRSILVDGQENLPAMGEKVIDENDAGGADTKQGETVEAPMDWFGYYAALAIYYLQTYIPSLPSHNIQPLHLAMKPLEREPFTISRLRSSVERLYVNARSPWGSFFVTIGQVAMWHDVAKSMKWLFVYILLTITSTFTPFFLAIPLYHLVYERLFPPTVSDLMLKEEEAARRTKEGHELADDIVQPEGGGPTIPGGLGGDFATGAARGFGFARDTVSAYAFGKEDGSHQGDAVSVDIFKPHVQSVVNRVLPTSSSDASTGKNAKEGPAEEPKESGKKGKSGDSKKGKSQVPSKTTKLREKWEEFKVTNGTGLIVVLDDLSDIHERVESLFAWRRPESSVKFALILVAAILATHFTPAIWMLKFFQIAIGAVFFVVIPVAARMERYEPISASLTSAPTMAEHVINVMRERAARGEPMPVYRPPAKTPTRKSTTTSTTGSLADPSNASTTSLPLTTTEIEDELVRIDSIPDSESTGTSTGKEAKRKVDWTGMRDQALAHAQTGTQWWQTGKDLWKGEKKVQFSWKGAREDWENVEKSALAARQVSLGPNGPGLHLSVHSTEEPSVYVKEGISYLARHAGYTGSLYLSSEGLMFVPLIASGKVADKVTDKATEDALQESVKLEAVEKKDVAEKRKPEIQVPLSSIIGMRKSNKTAMGCVVSAGLQIDVDDGTSIVFPFVASRDTVFNRLLALSKGTFRRV